MQEEKNVCIGLLYQVTDGHKRDLQKYISLDRNIFENGIYTMDDVRGIMEANTNKKERDIQSNVISFMKDTQKLYDGKDVVLAIKDVSQIL